MKLNMNEVLKQAGSVSTIERYIITAKLNLRSVNVASNGDFVCEHVWLQESGCAPVRFVEVYKMIAGKKQFLSNGNPDKWLFDHCRDYRMQVNGIGKQLFS